MGDALNIYTGGDRNAVLVPVEPGRSAPSDDRLNLRTLIIAFRRRIKLFLAVLGITVCLALLLTFRQTPLYIASASVVLKQAEEQVAPSAGSSIADVNGPDRTDTEVEIVRSREMAAQVSEALQLARDPDFAPGQARPGLMQKVRTLLGGDEAPARPLTPEQVQQQIIGRLQQGLAVTRFNETFSLTIAFTATKADDAARIANEYARQYTGSQLTEKQQESRSAITFLASRLAELRSQAELDTQKVQQYRIANNLLTTSGASLTEQEISSYNQAVATARAQAAEDVARLRTAQAQLQGGSTGDDVGEALGSNVVSGLRARQAEVSGRMAALTERYGSRHPDVLKTRSELNDINDQIQSEIHRVISNLEAKSRVSNQRLDSISGSLTSARSSLAQNNRAMVGLDDLERRAEASQALYESYLGRYKEVVARTGTERSHAKIISQAEVPGSPASPKPLLNLLLSLVIGSGLGLAAAFIAEMMFAGLTSGEEIEERLGLRYLGIVPAVGSVLPGAASPIQPVVDQPMSGFAESFRGLRTAILYAARGRAQVIAISSALPKEGKTTIAACLARTSALAGDLSVIVDCDVRRRGISSMFSPRDQAVGLGEVLRGTASLDDALVLDEQSGAYVLPIVNTDSDLPELLTGEAMNALLGQLRGRFSSILLDTAPILPVAETRTIAALADVLVIVTRWRSTPDHAVMAALRLIPAQTNVGGVVLSRVDMRKQVRYTHGDPSSYYKRYAEYYS